MERYWGTIIKYVQEKGFGFIDCRELGTTKKNSIFFHFSQLEEKLKQHEIGAKVEFELEDSNRNVERKEPLAVNITEPQIEMHTLNAYMMVYIDMLKKPYGKAPNGFDLEILFGRCIERNLNFFVVSGFNAFTNKSSFGSMGTLDDIYHIKGKRKLALFEDSIEALRNNVLLRRRFCSQLQSDDKMC